MEPTVSDTATDPDFTFDAGGQPDDRVTASRSPLDALREAYEEPLDTRETFRVPAVPGFSVEVCTELDWEDYDRYSKACTNKRGRTDHLKLSSLVVGALTRSIKYGGETWLDDAGRPVTFGSPALWSHLQNLGKRVTSAGEAAIVFFRRDADLIAVGGRIIEEAGYLDDAEDDDTVGPTSG